MSGIKKLLIRSAHPLRPSNLLPSKFMNYPLLLEKLSAYSIAERVPPKYWEDHRADLRHASGAQVQEAENLFFGVAGGFAFDAIINIPSLTQPISVNATFGYCPFSPDSDVLTIWRRVNSKLRPFDIPVARDNNGSLFVLREGGYIFLLNERTREENALALSIIEFCRALQPDI